MIRRTFGQIASMAGGKGTDPSFDPLEIQGVSTDTRTIQRGNLFVPLVGDRYDGHDYVANALEKGAAAVLWQESHRLPPPEGVPVILVQDTLVALQELARSYRSELNVRVIGITGSNGKTTTKDMTASVLGTTYRVHKTKGNLNNHIGLPLTLLQLDEQTEMAVIEMGMSGRGEIEFLSRLARPEAAIITNIGESHLLQLGSREEIARAKTEILSGLQPGGLFVYNGDEPLIEQVLPETPQPEALLRYRFGSEESNDLYPLGIMADPEGTYFKTNLQGSASYYIPLLGHHNVINALAAIAVSKYMGVQDHDIASGLRNLEITGMRIEKVKAKSGAVFLNDAYNASPTSMRAAIGLLEDLPGYNRKLAVLGDMLELGPKEEQFHREIGALLDPQTVDKVYAYGPLAKHIASEASKKLPAGRVKWFADKQQMIDALASEVKEGDLVLVKGSRGMRLEEVVQVLKDV